MTGTTLTLDANDVDAVVFDMDGVLTDTAALHARAWKSTFDEYLARRSAGQGSGEQQAPFDLDRDYRRHVDGKPRYDGVASFLAARGIELERGDPADPPDRETICGLGNRKNERFLALLRERGARRFEDATECVRALRAAGIDTAVISASRNATRVLAESGLDDLFAERIDGVVAREEGLEGKPAPDVFLEAVRRLGAEPARAAVVEDAVAGVEAGRRGGFGWVIGVARDGGGRRLEEAGADVVVGDLSEIAVGEAGRSKQAIDALPSALESLDPIVREIGRRRPILFLDFDGTLAPIVDRPEDATLPDATRRVLAEIAERRAVAIVSGRDLDDLRERVGLDALYYAGSHGLRLAGPGGWHREHEQARRFLPVLDSAEQTLRSELDSIEGAQVERKRHALAVHYRRVREADIARVREAVEAVREERRDSLRIGEGRKVLELRPALDWDKGRALDWLLEAIGVERAEACPIYVGDDVTDEDAFRAVARDGLAIVVRGRKGRTRARYVLDDPEAVRRWLLRLDEEMTRWTRR